MKPVKKILNYLLTVLALFSIELIVVWVLFLGAFIIFLLVTGEIFLYKEQQFDQAVFQWIESIRSPYLTSIMKGFTFLGTKEFVFISALLIFFYFLFIRKHKWYSIKVPVVCIGCISINLLIKSLFNRPRPLLPHLVKVSGLSFPSGHAMISFSFYGLLIYVCYKLIPNKLVCYTIISLLIILMHLIGFSRIYLGVHYASDVMAGFALGTIWLILSIVFLKNMERLSSKEIKIEEISDL